MREGREGGVVLAVRAFLDEIDVCAAGVFDVNRLDPNGDAIGLVLLDRELLSADFVAAVAYCFDLVCVVICGVVGKFVLGESHHAFAYKTLYDRVLGIGQIVVGRPILRNTVATVDEADAFFRRLARSVCEHCAEGSHIFACEVNHESVVIASVCFGEVKRLRAVVQSLGGGDSVVVFSEVEFVNEEPSV